MKNINMLVHQLHLAVSNLHFTTDIQTTKNTDERKRFTPVTISFKIKKMCNIKISTCLGIIGNFLAAQLQMNDMK